MNTFLNVLLIILAIVLVALVVLYFLGRKMEKRQVEQQQMLEAAAQTVLADSDEIPSLIFDEIDTGISGRTAQKVSEKLSIISRNHQVICITHLPQIAAMADCHYEIAKSVDKGKTVTRIHALDEEQMVEELARLLGGARITDAVRENAREMKKLAARKSV